MVSAAFIIALGYGLIAPLIPQFARSFDVSLAAASAVVSVFAGSRLIFAPVSGRLIDRFTERSTYLVGLVVVGVSTGLVAFAQNYHTVLILRGIAGLGSTMFTISAMGLIVKLAPPDIRGRANSVYASAFLIGNIIGPVIGAALSVLGMRIPFVIYGGAVLLAALLVWHLMPAHSPALEDAEHEQKRPLRFRDVMKLSSYRAVLVSGFYNGWSNIGVRVATLPLFASAIFAHGSSVSALAIAAFAAGNAIVMQFSGSLADRHGRKPLIVSGLVVNGFFTVSLGLTHTVPALLITSALAGAGAGLFNPAQQSVIGDVIGKERSGGKVLANFQMAQDLGAITGPIVVGLLAENWGFSTGFILCGAISLLAVVMWIVGKETAPSKVRDLNSLFSR